MEAGNHTSVEEEDNSNDNMKIIVYQVMAAQGVFITIANALTLLTFALNRSLVRRSTLSLLSVTAADGLVGVISVFKYAAKLTKTYEGDLAVAYKFLWLLFLSGSLFGLVLVAVERMCATLWPLRHRAAEVRTFLIGIALQWFISLIYSISCMIDDLFFNKRQKAKTVIPMLCLVLISLCYFAIYVKVKMQHQEHQQADLPRVQQRERELAKTLAIVIAISMMTWLPEVIYHLLPEYNSKTLEHRIFQVLRLVNSIVNPIIYVLRMQDFKKALKRTMRKVLCCKQNAISPTSEASKTENRNRTDASHISNELNQKKAQQT